jgi:Acetyl-CoA carboxylase alpha subunit
MMLLDFEKTIAELETKLVDMKQLADGKDDAVNNAIKALEKKILDLKKETFENLTAGSGYNFRVTLIDLTH